MLAQKRECFYELYKPETIENAFYPLDLYTACTVCGCLTYALCNPNPHHVDLVPLASCEITLIIYTKTFDRFHHSYMFSLFRIPELNEENSVVVYPRLQKHV